MCSTKHVIVILLFGIVTGHGLLTCTECSAQGGTPLDQLTLKGTHNSYESSLHETFGFADNNCPLMHHQPAVQVDAFGVYAVELDFSIESEGGILRAIVGHDGHCDNGCWTFDGWGKYLDVYFESLKNTKSFQYRPLIILLEKKCGWGVYDEPDKWMPFAESLAVRVFGANQMYSYDRWRLADNRTWPSVPELAKHVVLMGFQETSQDCATDGYGGGGVMFPLVDVQGHATLPTRPIGQPNCQSIAEYVTDVRSMQGILRSDWYQYEFTFDDSFAPPNPICVRAGATALRLSSNVDDPFSGSNCVDLGLTGNPVCTDACNSGASCDSAHFLVGQHGTFDFPFGSVGQAVARATQGGRGWTLLIEAGNYREAVTIGAPMTLRTAGGVVMIGK